MRSGQEPACDSGTYAQSRTANAMLSFFTSFDQNAKVYK